MADPVGLLTPSGVNTSVTPTSLPSSTPAASIAPPNTSVAASSSLLQMPPLNLPPSSPSDGGASLVAASTISPAQPGQSPTPALDAATQTAPPTPAPTAPQQLDSNGNPISVDAEGNPDDPSQDPNVEAAQGGVNQAEQQYQDESNSETGESDLLTSAQNSQGVNIDLNQVNSLSTQLASATAEYDTASQNAETQGINSGTPGVFYQGQQAAIQRQKAVVVGGIAAQLSAAQGNYTRAEALAEKTADLQFQDEQNKINQALQFVTLNKDTLTSAESTAADKIKQDATAAQDLLTQQKAAVSFALTNGVNAPFYQVGGTIYNTKTGLPYNTPQAAQAAGAAQDYSNVQLVNQSTTETHAAVVALASKYFDAGINLSDSLATAQQKAKGSAIFQKETYIAPSAQDTGLTQTDVDGLASTLNDYNGTKYLTPTDLTGYSAAQKAALTVAFKAAGIPTLSAKDSDAIDSIQAAQSDIQDLASAITTSTIQPKGFLDRPVSQAKATLGSWLQTNNSSALNTFNLTVVPLLSALKGSGSGGGGGASRLFNNISALLPVATDTVPVAQQKIKALNSLLDNAAQSIVPSGSSSGSGSSGSTTLMTGPDGNQYNVPNGQVAAFTKAGGHK